MPKTNNPLHFFHCLLMRELRKNVFIHDYEAFPFQSNEDFSIFDKSFQNTLLFSWSEYSLVLQTECDPLCLELPCPCNRFVVD